MYKVLLVEDEDMIRGGIKYSIDWLEIDCVVVGEACDGKEGMEKIRELRPDIVLTDINMPLMDGIAMIEEAQKLHTFSSIIISGYNEFHLAKRALHLGVTDFLVKPLEEEQLIGALESAKGKVKLMLKYDEIANLPAEAELRPPSFEAMDDKLKTSQHVAKMIAYVQENYHRKISIHHLVNLLGLSASYLSQKFKLETSYTFNDFLNRYRIHKAMEMLRAGEGKVYTIAQDCGFSDYKYFISIFKKYANCTPGQYQEFCERDK